MALTAVRADSENAHLGKPGHDFRRRVRRTVVNDNYLDRKRLRRCVDAYLVQRRIDSQGLVIRRHNYAQMSFGHGIEVETLRAQDPIRNDAYR
jgi:hypothetical protein